MDNEHLMIMKKLTTYFTLMLACILIACQNDDTVNFSYSPETPRAGESVSFSNLTKEGEEWAWTFGDGGESTVNSPTKVYRQPGTYTVTLKVDDKKYRTCTKTITILDTIPSIACSVDTIPYYQTVTFRTSFYNPNNEEVQYLWTFPESTIITSGDSTTSTVSVYFTEKSATVTVSVLLTIGKNTHSLSTTLPIADAPATALLFATTDGQLLRQRLYPNGAETPTAMSVSSEYTAQTRALILDKNDLYLLSNGIHRLNLPSGKVETMSSTAQAHTGYIRNYYLYWADATNIYALHTNVKTEHLFASTAQLTGFPHTAITAIADYTSLYLVAGDKGIYRFRESDRNSGTAPTTASILSEYAITHLAVDEIARKVYFISNSALYVSNIDGTYPVKIASEAQALTLDNASNRVYLTTAEGIGYLPLVQSQNNTTTAEITLINDIKQVVALALDNTPR